MKNHLVVGVRKGALTEEQAEAKYNAWLEAKTGAVANKSESLAKAEEEARAKALEAERAVNEARLAAKAPVATDSEDAEAVAEDGADSEE